MEEARVKVQYQGVFEYDEFPSQWCAVLRDAGGQRLCIWMGQTEAWSLFYAAEGEPPERPNTHDAMLACLTAAGAQVEEAYVNDLRDDTYYALLRLRVGDQVELVDVRPSDAVSLAVRAGCPIYVRSDILALSDRMRGQTGTEAAQGAA